jgi:uncharacterized protein
MIRVGKSFVVALLAIALCGSAPLHAAATADSQWVQVEKVDVRWSVVGPVVLLVVHNRAIPIFVDPTVAESIQSVLSGEKTPRPLTHELMRRVVAELGARVAQAQIVLKASTYYAVLKLIVGGVEKDFDSRSSDAIALAVLFNAPIVVPRQLLDSNGIALEQGSET